MLILEGRLTEVFRDLATSKERMTLDSGSSRRVWHQWHLECRLQHSGCSAGRGGTSQGHFYSVTELAFRPLIFDELPNIILIKIFFSP